MLSTVDSEPMSPTQVRQNLLQIVEEIENRVKSWKYPPASEELASEDDPAILEKREYLVFRRPLLETFQRNDLERMQIWLKFQHPTVASELMDLTEALAVEFPISDHVSRSEMDALVVDLAEAAYRIKLIAEAIPGSRTEGSDENEEVKDRIQRGKRKKKANKSTSKGNAAKNAVGRHLTKQEHENRKLVHKHYQYFKQHYHSLGYSNFYYKSAAQWMTDKHEDMAFLLEDIADPTDYDKIGKRVASKIKAYQETREPTNLI